MGGLEKHEKFKQAGEDEHPTLESVLSVFFRLSAKIASDRQFIIHLVLDLTD